MLSLTGAAWSLLPAARTSELVCVTARRWCRPRALAGACCWARGAGGAPGVVAGWWSAGVAGCARAAHSSCRGWCWSSCCSCSASLLAVSCWWWAAVAERVGSCAALPAGGCCGALAGTAGGGGGRRASLPPLLPCSSSSALVVVEEEGGGAREERVVLERRVARGRAAAAGCFCCLRQTSGEEAAKPRWRARCARVVRPPRPSSYTPPLQCVRTPPVRS